MADPDLNLRAAEQVAEILRRHQVPTVVIGAVALAAHHYVRHTEDIDLGVVADASTLEAVAADLREVGFTAELRQADAQDPLGGVIDVSGAFGLVQIISFAGRFPAVIQDAARESTLLVREHSNLRLAPIPHLVALKLYAGGYKSKADIIELLSRNPGVDLECVRETCQSYRLPGLEELLRELPGA